MNFNTLVEAVFYHADKTGDKAAIIMRDTVISYSQMALLIRKTAFILKNRYHIDPGDRVMLSGVSKPEYLIILLGIQFLHAITVPFDKSWAEGAVIRINDYIKPKIVITDMTFHEQDISAVSMRLLFSAAQECEDMSSEYVLPDLDSTAEILFTTGTTGIPKGVMLSYNNIKAILSNNIEGVGVCPEDIVLDALPLFHSLGLREARMTLFVGATLVLQNGFAFLRELRSNIEKYKCSGFVCVPTIIEQLIRSVDDFKELFQNFRYMEIGSGSLSYGLRKRLPQILPDTDIINTWGATETGGVIFLDIQRRMDKITSLGKPISSALVKVIGEGGREIQSSDANNAGRLAVYGDMVMLGYYEMPDLNRDILANGWFLTNDLVYMDDEGFVYMLGRADDIINVGGEKVSPIEVENIVSEFEQVVDAACIGIADPILGEVPALFVKVENSFDEESLVRFMAGRLERYKLPKAIYKVKEIPRNRLKKLDRNAVRDLWKSMIKE